MVVTSGFFAHKNTSGGSTVPAISPLYKPLNAGHQRVAQWADRVVITWSTIETGDTGFYVAPGVGPRRRAQFQAVLGADGSIRFNYRYVPFADGVVGLFPEVERGEILARISDGVDPELPGHLDVLEVVIFANEPGSGDRGVRDPRPDSGACGADGGFLPAVFRLRRALLGGG